VVVGALFLAPLILADPVPASASFVAGSTLELQVGGRAGVPTDASAAVLNVTVVTPAASGFATVWPCGEPMPDASNLNFYPGQSIANLVVTKLGVDGKACFATSASTELLADIAGFFPTGSGFTAIANPTRLLDTRSGIMGPTVRPFSVQHLFVASRAGVAVDAKAVLLNVTITDPSTSGFATVWPCGEPQPDASNLNFVAGQTVANLVFARIGAAGDVCIVSSAATNLLADISGYFPDASTFTPIANPARVLDTRVASGVPTVRSNTMRHIPIGGRTNVPANAIAAVVNVTVTRPAASGFVTLWPCGEAQPEASNVNVAAGQTVPNLVVSKLGTDGEICVVASVDVDLVVDVSGFFPAGSSFVPVPNPVRLLDTRNGTGTSDACVVSAPPAGLGLDPFYTKYCSVRGFPIVANTVVSDVALRQAWFMIDAMLDKRPDVVGPMNSLHIRFGIIGANQATLDMPEYTTLQFTNPETDWNTRTRGLGATPSRPLVSAGEENLLCLPNGRYANESITIHEFAHAFLQDGIELLDPGFRSRLSEAFVGAIGSGKWANTYAATNADEYWAEGVQDWFDSNEQQIPTNGIHNNINTRAELVTYDPALAALIAEVFPASDFTARCPDGRPQTPR
jgi:hypothetical protein